MAGRDATRKREREWIQYPISYARTVPRASRTYDKEKESQRGREKRRARVSERERKAGWSRSKREREGPPRYTTQLVSSVFPSFGSQYSDSLSPAPSPESSERVCSPTDLL